MPTNNAEIVIAAQISDLFGFDSKESSSSTAPRYGDSWGNRHDSDKLDNFWNIVNQKKATSEKASSQELKGTDLLISQDNSSKYKKSATTEAQKQVLSYMDTIPDNDTKSYLTHLAFLESRFVPDVKNKLGYVGVFQFGSSALQTMIDRGVIEQMDKETFRTAPVETQTKAAIALANLNWKIIKDDAEKLLDQKINGVKVTKKGLMAASHLVGAKDVKRWLRSNGKETSKDANGTTIEKYLSEFQYI